MRQITAILLAVCWVTMFIGTHLPGVPKGDPMVADKLAHFGGFLTLAVVMGLYLAVRCRFSLLLLALAFGVLALYGAFDEWSQGFVPNRTPDVQDWIANLLGSLTGLLVIGVPWWFWQRSRSEVSDGENKT